MADDPAFLAWSVVSIVDLLNGGRRGRPLCRNRHLMRRGVMSAIPAQHRTHSASMSDTRTHQEAGRRPRRVARALPLMADVVTFVRPPPRPELIASSRRAASLDGPCGDFVVSRCRAVLSSNDAGGAAWAGCKVTVRTAPCREPCKSQEYGSRGGSNWPNRRLRRYIWRS